LGGLELAGRVEEPRVADENGLVRNELPDRNRGFATREEAAAFQERLFRLLERRTAIYTMGDSTSVPKHAAVDLLRSVSFVLGIDPEHPEIPERLLRVDLEDEFRRRLADIERKIEKTGTLWREVVDTMPSIPNVALQDTLVEIGNFPKRYDFRSMAHEIPCSIDYPLCHPVPETLVGVDYINEYLNRLLVEAEFLRRFELDACVRVLKRSSPDYVDLLVNLYEPIATNALGRAMIGEDPAGLAISDETHAEIARRLGPLGQAQRGNALREAAESTCDSLGIHDDRAREYLRALVPELLPRIAVGLAHGDLRGVFVG
jgi:hypothetical protein